MRRKLIFLAVFVLLTVALVVSAAGLVPNCTGVNGECDVSDFFNLLSHVLNYFIFTLAVPVATIAIAYAGIEMAIHPAEEAKRTEAKKILLVAIQGLALVLGAWLIVHTIVKYLVKPDIQTQIDQYIPAR